MLVDFLLLAGGKSSRFSSDKSMLKINDEYIVSRIINEAKESKLFNKIYIASNPKTRYKKEEIYEILGAIELEDEIHNIGPLGGILSALKVSNSSYIFLWACDMPLFKSDVANIMIEKLNDTSKDAISVKTRKGLEPLCSLINVKKAKEIIEELLVKKDYRVRSLLEALEYITIDFNEDYFFNINSEEDFSYLKDNYLIKLG